jgi:hypothetical protein
MPQVFRDGQWIDVEPIDLTVLPLPAPAPWIYRLPGIRRVRWIYYSIQMGAWNEMWLGAGFFPTTYDMRVLDAIERGEI